MVTVQDSGALFWDQVAVFRSGGRGAGGNGVLRPRGLLVQEGIRAAVGATSLGFLFVFPARRKSGQWDVLVQID